MKLKARFSYQIPAVATNATTLRSSSAGRRLYLRPERLSEDAISEHASFLQTFRSGLQTPTGIVRRSYNPTPIVIPAAS